MMLSVVRASFSYECISPRMVFNDIHVKNQSFVTGAGTDKSSDGRFSDVSRRFSENKRKAFGLFTFITSLITQSVL